jgi:hypothetical protein
LGNGTVLWQSGTTTAAELDMQGDGNLVLYDSAGQPVTVCATFCASNTTGNLGAILDLSNTGDLVIYSGVGGTPVLRIH